MVANVKDRAKIIRIAAICLAGAGAAAAWASVALSGTKTGAVLSLGFTLGPVLLYAALVAPTVFPLGLYAFVAPLDEILTLPAFGTVGRLVGAATAGALFFYMLRTKRFVDPPRSLAYWIVLYLWMGASLLWAIDVPEAWTPYATALQLFGLYFVVSIFPITLRQFRTLLYAVIAGGTAAALYGIHLYTSGVTIQNRLSLSDINASGDPNHFAASLIVPLALTVYFALWSRKTAVRLAMLPVAGVLLSAIFLSGSRGAMLGVLALLIFLIVRDPHRKLLAVLAVVLLAAGAAVAGPEVLARFSEAGVNGGAGRTDIWHVGLIAFTQNWLFGAGYQNFPFAYDRAYIHVFQPFYTAWHRAPHNLLLGTAVDLGAIGLVMMLLAWAGQFKLLSFIKTDDGRYGMRIALQACIVALFVVAMFSDIMIRKYTWLLFMLVALARNARLESTADA